jgi:hypothetical protein
LKLVNLKNEIVVADNLFIAKTWKEKAQGLLGKDEAEPIHFKTRWGIHTFGMKFPIDVLVCDDNFGVKKIFQNVGSGKVIAWNPVWSNVFEFKAGTVQTADIALGDKLKIGG